MATQKGKVTRFSETTKWYPSEHQICKLKKEEWSFTLSGCPGNKMTGWLAWTCKPTHTDLYPMPSLSITWHRNLL